MMIMIRGSLVPRLGPGIYDIPDAAYHADCCITPALSASLIKKMVYPGTPAHAYHAHPRYNPDMVQENKAIYDAGSASHKFTLGSDDQIALIPYENYTTKAAKAARDAAYAADQIPVKVDDIAGVKAMARAMRAQLDVHTFGYDFFQPGTGLPERTLIWDDGGILCRCKVDWLPNKGDVFPDLKTTAVNAMAWSEKTMWDTGADIQAAMIRRGAKALMGIKDAKVFFAVQENVEPYCMMIHGLTPEETALADARVEKAIATWRWCVNNNKWPGHPGLVNWASRPGWRVRQLEEVDAIEQVYAENGSDWRDSWINWQAPLNHEEQE